MPQKKCYILAKDSVSDARRLVGEGKIHGVVSIGDSTGSQVAADVMRAISFGIPKLIISSTAALPGMSTRYIGTDDITLMHSVIEARVSNKIVEHQHNINCLLLGENDVLQRFLQPRK